MKSAIALIVSLAICFAVAGIGSWVTAGGLREWYPSLAKPSWNPPNWIFGPVWSTLFAMMAVSAWLLWEQRERTGAHRALGLFALQLALNFAWSGIFFGVRQPGWALVEIVVLWVAIAATIAASWSVDRRASALLIPYLGWVAFASFLNLTLWRLNSP